jgi:magnesium chelatase family protein
VATWKSKAPPASAAACSAPAIIQLERYPPEKNIYANSQTPPKLIRKHCAISAEGDKILETAIQRLGLSARAHDRILKVSRTIADLEGAP